MVSSFFLFLFFLQATPWSTSAPTRGKSPTSARSARRSSAPPATRAGTSPPSTAWTPTACPLPMPPLYGNFDIVWGPFLTRASAPYHAHTRRGICHTQLPHADECRWMLAIFFPCFLGGCAHICRPVPTTMMTATAPAAVTPAAPPMVLRECRRCPGSNAPPHVHSTPALKMPPRLN